MAFPGDHKTVQFARGVDADVNAYTGPQGEVIVNVTDNELYLHDGATLGGHRIANWANIVAAIAAITIVAGDNATALAGVDVVTRSWPATAFGQFAPKASPALSGTPTSTTAADADNSTRIATTQWVKNWLTSISGDNATALAGVGATPKLWPASVFGQFAPVSSPVLTGTPSAPTPAAGTNSDRIATTSFVASNFQPFPYTGSENLGVSFPVGHIVVAELPAGESCPRNGIPSLTLKLGSTGRYLVGGSDTALAGTWRGRGNMTGNTVIYTLLQRVA